MNPMKKPVASDTLAGILQNKHIHGILREEILDRIVESLIRIREAEYGWSKQESKSVTSEFMWRQVITLEGTKISCGEHESIWCRSESI